MTARPDEWRESVEWSLQRIEGRSDKPVKGCSERDVAALEARVGRCLPAAYVCFLRAAGAEPGDCLAGIHVAYSKLDVLQGSLAHEMARSDVQFPGDGFCFASNPSYAFLWFPTGLRDDPRAYLFVEEDKESEEVASTFSQWLESSVSEQWGVTHPRRRVKP